MDTESVKSLVSLLIWGGLFFLMMRFGCGAHIMGGHGHHGGREGKSAGGSTKDPVCGMDVDPQRAAAASVHNGETYYFCSASCRDKFERAPEKYLAASVHEGHEHGGHHHG
jgi:YHS domain-containing protein